MTKSDTGRRMAEHLERPELIRLALERGVSSSHLDDCPECRELLALFTEFPFSGSQRLSPPLPGWLERAYNIVPARQVKGWIAHLTFDSWKLPVPAGLRSTAQSDDRRMVYESEIALIDLRMEQSEAGYSFVAKIEPRKGTMPEESVEITKSRAGVPQVYLTVAKEKIPANPDGFHYWESRRLPKSITVNVGGVQISLPELSWKRPGRS